MLGSMGISPRRTGEGPASTPRRPRYGYPLRHDKVSEIFQYGRNADYFNSDYFDSYSYSYLQYSSDVSESEREAAFDAFARSYQANVDLWFDCFDEKRGKFGKNKRGPASDGGTRGRRRRAP